LLEDGTDVEIEIRLSEDDCVTVTLRLVDATTEESEIFEDGNPVVLESTAELDGEVVVKEGASVIV
jgi:hypothetical protein